MKISRLEKKNLYSETKLDSKKNNLDQFCPLWHSIEIDEHKMKLTSIERERFQHLPQHLCNFIAHSSRKLMLNTGSGRANAFNICLVKNSV